jgi:predicted ester cyclase
MKLFLKQFVLLIPLLFLTSCFDILDKVNVKADGSGEYTVILNASKSKTRLASISKMETINGKKVPKKAEIENKINEAAKIFRATPGISNVKTSMDFDNYIIKLSCNFKKIENINAGLEQLKAKNILGKMIPSHIYNQSLQKKSFVRNKINTFKTDYDKMSKADKEIFNGAKYISVLQFENTIKSQSNTLYLLSPNKKAIKFEANILDLILQKKQLQNNIFFQ